MADRLDRERDEFRSAVDWALHNDHAETVAALLALLRNALAARRRRSRGPNAQ